MSRPAVVLVLALLAALLGAGCLGDGGAAPGRVSTAQDLQQLAAAMPPAERPVVASVAFHEEVKGDAVDIQGVDGDTAWDPRDVNLTYHGIQETHDEFARVVPAYHFRFDEMVFVVDAIAFSLEGIDINGHYEPHAFEFAFDAADGRLVSLTDLTDQSRSFGWPQDRDPLASWSVIGMAFKVFEANGRQEVVLWSVDGHDQILAFEPDGGAAPLPGDCTMWEPKVRWEPPWPGTEDAVGLSDTAELNRRLLCVEAGAEVPLWMYSGNPQGSYELTRTGPSITVPDFSGAAAILPPVSYPVEPWEEVTNPLGLPLPDALLAPPTADGGRWAQELQERAAALTVSPGYLRYRLASQTPYVDVSLMNIQLQPLRVLNMTPPPLPLLGERTEALTVFFLHDGATQHSHMVTTHNGDPEGPDVHLADPNGNDFPETGTVPTADDLLPLVPDGFLEGQVAPLNRAERLDLLLFLYVANDLDEDGAFEGFESYAIWLAMQDCTQDEDGWALSANGVTGHVTSLAVLHQGTEECGGGGAPLEALLAEVRGQRVPGLGHRPGSVETGGNGPGGLRPARLA